MKAKNKVVYVPPVYEEVQHEVTSVDDKNEPMYHTFPTKEHSTRNDTASAYQ